MITKDKMKSNVLIFIMRIMIKYISMENEYKV